MKDSSLLQRDGVSYKTAEFKKKRERGREKGREREREREREKERERYMMVLCFLLVPGPVNHTGCISVGFRKQKQMNNNHGVSHTFSQLHSLNHPQLLIVICRHLIRPLRQPASPCLQDQEGINGTSEEVENEITRT